MTHLQVSKNDPFTGIQKWPFYRYPKFDFLKILETSFLEILFEIVYKPNDLAIRSEILYGNLTDQALYDHYIKKFKKNKQKKF